MKQTSRYLYLNRYSIYYFRYIVPLDIRRYIGFREIKFSLGTHDPKCALRKCHLICHYVDSLFEKVRIKMMQFILKKKSMSPTGHVESIELEIDPNHFQAEITALRETRVLAKDQSLLDVFEKIELPNQHTNMNQHSSSTPLLSTLIQQFYDDRMAEGTWTKEETGLNELRTLNTLQFIVGDMNCGFLDRTAAKEVRKILCLLPTNRNKKPKYKNLTVDEVLSLNIDDKDKFSVRNIQKHLSTFNRLFDWALKENILTRNPFDGITVKDHIPASEKRDIFSTADLLSIFGTKIYTQLECSESYKYWIPLIALMTGARRGEIAQLELNDIKKVENIWVFDINTNTTENSSVKTTKNHQSIRRVPIHPKLIKLGLIEHVNHLKETGVTRLFPDLTFTKREGYGRKVGDWFNDDYLPSIGIDSSKKVFHSFRHTLSNELNDIGAPLNIIQQLTGHKTSSSSVMQDVYLKNLKMTKHYNWLLKIKCTATLDKVIPYVNN